MRLFWHPVQPEMRLRLHLRLVLVVLVWEWSGRIVAAPRRRRGWAIVSRGDDELHESKLEVLQAIPETPSGAPSTNSSMWPQQVRRLRAAVARLEVIARVQLTLARFCAQLSLACVGPEQPQRW